MALLARLGRVSRALGIALPMALLAACGGGGGGEDPGSFSLSTHKISFAASRATFDAMPAPETVTATVNGVSSGTLYIRIEVAGDAVTVGNIVVTSDTTGQATIYPGNPEVLGPGDHKATVTVHACTTGLECTSGELAGSPQRIDIDYTVSGLALSERSLEYTVGNTVVTADLTKDIAVAGYPDAEWTATSDADWLLPSRTPVDGSAATLTAKVDETVLTSLNNGIYHGTITMTPTAGDPVQVTATLNVARTEARVVSPGTEIAGSAMEVTVRGDNFDAITVTGVRFGSIAAASFHVVGPTEIRATHPALPAGSYPVTVENAAKLGRSLASMSVVDPPSMATIAMAHPPATPGWYPRGVVYDAGREALLVGLLLNDGSGESRILRYTYDGAAWQGPSQVTLTGGLTTLALSMDGQRLLAGMDSAVILQLDPATLSTLSTSDPGGAYFEYLANLPLTSDGFVLGPLSMNASGYGSVVKYSIRDAAFVDFPEGINLMGDRSHGIASADGSTILMGNNPYEGDVSQLYDASTGSFRPVHLEDEGYGMATDRTGSRFVVGNSGIYDKNLSLVGRLPDGLSNVVMSRDGSRVYALDFDRKLWAFGLGYVGGAFTVSPLAGPVTLAADPSPNDGFAHYPVDLTLSPDGGTLFISGTKCAIVMPVP
jgi:hypothetical protein